MNEKIDELLGLELESIQREQSSYTVPETIILEVKEYLEKIKDPKIEKDEWIRLLNWMKQKEQEDKNYELARLELTVGEDSKKPHPDPESSGHRINELRYQLSKK